MTGHTPGPLKAGLPNGAQTGCRFIRDQFGTNIAWTEGLADDEIDAANACLFAAAPELLEALYGAQDTLSDVAHWLWNERAAQHRTNHVTDWTGLYSFIDAIEARVKAASSVVAKATIT